MFYQIYRDRDILAGASWFDPDDGILVQVSEMPKETGDGEVTLVEKGDLYITEKRLKEALSASEMFEEQPPPNPPEGRKHWFSRPWSPPPQPGNLFWMPSPVRGFKIMTAWMEWSRMSDERRKFSELPSEMQQEVIFGAREVARYHGIDVTESEAVIERWEGAEEQKKRDWPNAKISSKPEQTVLSILKRMGIPNAQLES